MGRCLVFVLAALLAQSAPARPLSESFTTHGFPPVGWTAFSRDGGSVEFVRSTDRYRSEPVCAHCPAEGDRRNSDWLCTPAVCPAGNDTLLSLWYRSHNTSRRESLSILVSTSDRQPRSFVHFLGGIGIGINSYPPETDSLAQFAGQRVYAGLEYCSDTSALGICVDDVTGPPLFLHDVGVSEIIVPPDSVPGETVLFPAVTITNYGDTIQSSFRAYLIIQESATGMVIHHDSVVVPKVNPESSLAVVFTTSWRATPGIYWVKSHTALAGDQQPSNDTCARMVAVTPALPVVTVLLPNGGEVWQIGSCHDIAWTHSGGPPDGDSIWYRTGDGDTWRFIAETGPGSGGYSWESIPNTPSESCLVRIRAFNDIGSAEDVSDDCFSIVFQNVRVDDIVTPTGTIDSGTVVTPRAVVSNLGSRSETFPVTFRIGEVYEETVAVATLRPGQVDTIDFPVWIAQPTGEYDIWSFTLLDADMTPEDDTARGLCAVVALPRHDVTVTAILAPTGTIDSGTVVTPRAVVSNIGNRSEDVPLSFRIGDGYTQTLTRTLAPGQTDTVAFPDWIAQPVGTLGETCFASLPADIDRSNDTARAAVTVQALPRHDVTVTAILAPTGTIDSGTVVTPAAIVTNSGSRDESFPVTFCIAVTDAADIQPQRQPGLPNDGYYETVHQFLAAGQTDTVRFPAWVAQPTGRHVTTAFASLENDDDRSNDTALNTVDVALPARYDVGAVAILAPGGTLDSGTFVVPLAVVHNWGTRRAVFPATFRIGQVYDQTMADITLAPGQTDTITFQEWVARPPGRYVALCFTALEGDINGANDSTRGADSVVVLSGERHDVGVLKVLAPGGELDSGEVMTPRAVVRNFGTVREEFAVSFAIDGGYSCSTRAHIEPGQLDTMEFSDWTAMPVGRLKCLCFTYLPTDTDRSNDTAGGAVSVAVPVDIGTEAILRPSGCVQLGDGQIHTSLVPAVRIRNFGRHDAFGFKVRLRIDSVCVWGGDTIIRGCVFEKTLVVSQPLLSGAAAEFCFDVTSLCFCHYIVRCSTILDGDCRPANDQLVVLSEVTAQALSSGPGRFRAAVYSRAGELVFASEKDVRACDALLVVWSGLDESRRRVPPGTYVCVLRFEPVTGPAEQQTTKLLVTSRFAGAALAWRKP